MGPFETGLLLAETPREYHNCAPYSRWLTNDHFQHAGLYHESYDKMLRCKTFNGAYSVLLEHGGESRDDDFWDEATHFVDKCPEYSERLKQVIPRIGKGTPIFVIHKELALLHKSWVDKRNVLPNIFTWRRKNYLENLAECLDHDSLYIIPFLDYVNNIGEYNSKIMGIIAEHKGVKFHELSFANYLKKFDARFSKLHRIKPMEVEVKWTCDCKPIDLESTVLHSKRVLKL
jgi:hypothetical protein